MITIQLISEDFKVRELQDLLEQQKSSDDLDISIVQIKKEGMANWHDAVQLVFDHQDLLANAAISIAFKEILLHASKQIKNFLSPDPHILIIYGNGREKKIYYEGKSEIAVTRELLSEIEDGEVVKVYFIY